MAAAQLSLVRALASVTPVAAFMRTHWGWPAAESVHFVGLTLLMGALVPWDLRLLGVARNIPIAAANRLIPWALTGFAITALSGVMFLMTEPTEYVYNPAFHYKVLFMVIAAANALAFYLTIGARALAADSGDQAPALARVMAVISLAAWLGVIVAGRLLTFYRPGWCGAETAAFLSTCVPIR